MKPYPLEPTEVAEPERRELDELVARFAHRVRYFARRVELRYGLDPQWRDDLISAGNWGLLKALRNRREGAHAQELSAYVSKRVEGAVIDEARRVLSRMANHTDCDPLDLEGASMPAAVGLDWSGGPGELDPEGLADRNARWRTIERSVGHLEDDHRDLLWAYAEGRSISEIARQAGRSAARLQNQMTRITRQIRAHSPELRRLLRYEI